MNIVLRRTVSVTAMQRYALAGDRMHSPIEKRRPLENNCWRSPHNRRCAQMLHLKTTPGTFFLHLFLIISFLYTDYNSCHNDFAESCTIW